MYGSVRKHVDCFLFIKHIAFGNCKNSNMLLQNTYFVLSIFFIRFLKEKKGLVTLKFSYINIYLHMKRVNNLNEDYN